MTEINLHIVVVAERKVVTRAALTGSSSRGLGGNKLFPRRQFSPTRRYISLPWDYKRSCVPLSGKSPPPTPQKGTHNSCNKRNERIHLRALSRPSEGGLLRYLSRASSFNIFQGENSLHPGIPHFFCSILLHCTPRSGANFEMPAENGREVERRKRSNEE